MSLKTNLANGFADKSKQYEEALKTNKKAVTAVKKQTKTNTKNKTKTKKEHKNKMHVVLPTAKKKTTSKVLASYSLDSDMKEKLTKLARKQGYSSTSTFLNDLIKNL